MRGLWMRGLTMPLAVGASAIILFAAVGDALFSLVRLRLAQRRAAETLAWSLAEEAAFAAAGAPTGRATIAEVGGASARARIAPVRPDEFEIVVHGREGDLRFRCDLLAGQAPRPLGIPFSLRVQDRLPERLELPDPPRRLGADELPALAPEMAQLPAGPAGLGGAVRLDSEIAVLRLRGATEAKDYAFRPAADGVLRIDPPPHAVIRLDGHLWIDRGEQPLVLELPRPLTIVVEGNLYLGRSLDVRGQGRLVIVVRRGTADGFADRDLDGAWSPGDHRLRGDPTGTPRGATEGSGSVYFGLPGSSEVPADLLVGATIVAEGELHAVAARVLVRGALVGAHGLTAGAQARLLEVHAESVPVVSRERIPGFLTSGRPRPGWVQRVQ